MLKYLITRIESSYFWGVENGVGVGKGVVVFLNKYYSSFFKMCLFVFWKK